MLLSGTYTISTMASGSRVVCIHRLQLATAQWTYILTTHRDTGIMSHIGCHREIMSYTHWDICTMLEMTTNQATTCLLVCHMWLAISIKLKYNSVFTAEPHKHTNTHLWYDGASLTFSLWLCGSHMPTQMTLCQPRPNIGHEIHARKG